MKIRKKFIDVNPFSRPGVLREDTRAIVVHWVANPGSTAMFTRNFFDSLKVEKKSPHFGGSWFASTPYIVGLEGEIVQTMPDEEMHWHAGDETYTPLAEACFDLTGYGPNKSSIGVELCHPDLTGQFNNDTMDSAIKLFAAVMFKYGIDQRMIFTHHDIVGWKRCPKYFCDYPQAFIDFKTSVVNELRRKIDEDKAQKTNRLRTLIHRIHGTGLHSGS